MKKELFLLILAGIMLSISACVTKNETNEIVDTSGIALLIIDIQNDYFEGGSHTLYEPIEALKNAEEILSVFRQNNAFTVIHVQHNSGIGSGFMEEGTWGAQIHDNLTPLTNEVVITKRKISSFEDTNLEEVLRERNIYRLVIIGMQTNVCVEATVKDGKALGFQIFVLDDACAALSSDIHNDAIERMRGDYAFIVNTSEYLQGI